MGTLATIRLGSGGDPPPIEATRALDHGLFVGRLLGVDIAAAAAVVERLRGCGWLSPEDQRTLAATYATVEQQLARALDRDGRAIAGPADALYGSIAIANDADGVICLTSARVRLIDLARTLGDIGCLLAAAERRALAVEISYD